MFRKSLSMAAIAAAFLGVGAGFTQPAPQVTANAPRRAKKGLFNDMVLPSGFRLWGTRGAGITMAQQKRAARKQRNVRRHKQSVRG